MHYQKQCTTFSCIARFSVDFKFLQLITKSSNSVKPNLLITVKHEGYFIIATILDEHQ